MPRLSAEWNLFERFKSKLNEQILTIGCNFELNKSIKVNVVYNFCAFSSEFTYFFFRLL